jgi:hypothetical protein
VRLDSIPYFCHKIKVEMDIVNGIQYRSQDFSGHEQVPQISPGKKAASVTRTGAIQRLIIQFVFFILDFNLAARSKHGAVSGIA